MIEARAVVSQESTTQQEDTTNQQSLRGSMRWAAHKLTDGKVHVFCTDHADGLYSLCGLRYRAEPPVRYVNGRRVQTVDRDVVNALTAQRWTKVPREVRPKHGEWCRNCQRSWFATYDRDQLMPEATSQTVERGSKIPVTNVREIPGRVFRVVGESDIYTVTVPSDVELASVCTCMAAKTNPSQMCKHQVAVFLIEGGIL